MILQIIHLSDQTVTCARFRQKGSSLLPVSGVRLAFDTFEQLPELLLEQWPPLSEETRTVLSIPTGLLSLRKLQLPISDRKKIRSILPLELASDTAEENNELACDAIKLDTGEQLAGWADQSTVLRLIELLASINMEPEVVTCHPLSWHRLPLLEKQSVVILDTEALAVVKNGELQFCRLISTHNPESVLSTLAALELDYAITPTARYRLDTSAILNDELPFPLPDELTAQPGSGDLQPEALLNCYAIARAYSSGDIFNLRNGSLAWTGARSYLLKQFRLPLLLGTLLLVLVLGEAGLRWYLLQRDIAAVNKSIAAIYKGVFPARTKAADQTGELKSEIKRLQNGVSGNNSLQFLQFIAQSKEDQIPGFSEVEYDGQQFRLKGDARNTPAVTVLTQKLTAAGWVLEQPELTSRPDGTVLFVVKGRSKGVKP